MHETANWSDQRNAVRQRTLKRGRALVNGVEVAEVTVRNMSLTGARLISPACENLPETFTLCVGDEGLTRDVEVRSRSATGLGVRFLKPLSTREFGAEFLQAKSSEAREKSVAEQRAELVQRAREGLERLDLGFVAPPLAMPEPVDAGEDDAAVEVEPEGETVVATTDGPAIDDTVQDDPRSDDTIAPAPLAGPDSITATMPNEATTDEAATDEAATDEVATDEAPEDDGLGEGALARTARTHPPRAVRRHLPWTSAARLITAH